MTKQSFSIAKLTGVIVIIFVIISLSIESTTGGIHMHDTYFVMNAAVKWILFIILSLFIGSLMGAIAGRQSNATIFNLTCTCSGHLRHVPIFKTRIISWCVTTGIKRSLSVFQF